MFGTYSETYCSDLELVKKLGLRTFKIRRLKNGMPECGTRYLGTTEEGGFKVRVYVNCLPAQWFLFEAKNIESGKILRIETGTGSLNEYWDKIEKIFTPFIKIDEIKRGRLK